MGDHGWKLGDHNSWGKMTNYNIDLKVPVIVRYPNQERKGIKTDGMIELVDLFPSICEMAGIDIPDYMQGTSFVPLTKNPELPWKDATFSQFHRRPKVSADGERYMGYSINTKKYHFISWYGWDSATCTRGEFKSYELYDKEFDSFETQNLSERADMRDVITTLSNQLASGWRRALPKNQE